MKIIRKITWIVLLAGFPLVVSAQNTGCSVKKSFKAYEGIYLQISNKYGDITVLRTDNDSATICATITITQADKELSVKNMNLINIAIEKVADTIRIKTSFDDRFFSSQNRKGRTGFSIDYVINLPGSANIKINNSFGDVSLDDFSGIINVKMSQGDFNASRLTRGNLKPVSTLTFEYGKINIDEVNWLSIKSRHCQMMQIDKAKALLLSTEFSKISLGDISSVVIESNSDSYEIDQIRNFISASTYSGLKINKLTGQFQAKTTFGSLSVEEIMNGFSLFDLQSQRTPVEITTQKGTSFNVDLELSKSAFDSPLLDNQNLTIKSENNLTSLKGVSGNQRDTKSLMKIRMDMGRLELK